MLNLHPLELLQVHNGEAMPKQKSKTRTNRKLERARRIVVLCMRVARKNVNATFVDLIAAHIVAELPTKLMKRLVNGDHGRPMLAAMKLTLPYFSGDSATA